MCEIQTSTPWSLKRGDVLRLKGLANHLRKGDMKGAAQAVLSDDFIGDILTAANNKAQMQISLDAPQFVQWFGAGQFVIQEAELANGVYLKGTLS